MDNIDLKLEEIIEGLQDHISEMDPGDPEYGKMLGRLDSLLRQRDNHFKNESDAVMFDAQLELDKEKLMRETEIGQKKNRNEAVRNVVEIGKTIVTIVGTGILVLIGYQKEYDPEEPINISSKVWNLIPKTKL